MLPQKSCNDGERLHEDLSRLLALKVTRGEDERSDLRVQEDDPASLSNVSRPHLIFGV